MPVCFSCGLSCDKLAPTGLCPKCANISTPQPSIDPSMIGLSSLEKAVILKQRADQKAQEQQHAERLQSLSSRGYDGYYEYKVIDLYDHFIGNVDIEKMSSFLNELGLDGWHLITAYSNEIGVNAGRIAGIGLNSSVSQNVLIFERFIRI